MKTLVLLYLISFSIFANENLINDKGMKFGKIVNISGNRQSIQDEHGQVYGYYDSKTNKTINVHGQIIGVGNQLIILLPMDTNE